MQLVCVGCRHGLVAWTSAWMDWDECDEAKSRWWLVLMKVRVPNTHLIYGLRENERECLLRSEHSVRNSCSSQVELRTSSCWTLPFYHSALHRDGGTEPFLHDTLFTNFTKIITQCVFKCCAFQKLTPFECDHIHIIASNQQKQNSSTHAKLKGTILSKTHIFVRNPNAHSNLDK